MCPLILRIVITTTLISRRTPRPLKVIPLMRRAHETMTIVASKRLKPSARNDPDEAKVLSTISMRKAVRKTKSIA